MGGNRGQKFVLRRSIKESSSLVTLIKKSCAFEYSRD